MKLLLDECIPARLRLNFPGHDVYTVEQAGLKGLKNGALIRAAETEFDVLLTVDQNVQFQQNVSRLSIAIILLVARSNRYSDLRTSIPRVLQALRTIRAGDVVAIHAS